MVRGILPLVGFCLALGGALPGCGGESRRHHAPSPATPNGSETAGAGGEPSGGNTTDTAMPDAGTAVPDAGTTVPDAGTTVPDAGTTMLDGGPTEQPVDDAENPAGGSAGFIWLRGIGNWFVISVEDGNDDATLDLLDPPRGTSTRACHVTGSDHPRGVDLWAQLNHPQGNPIDLSDYAGFTFWARLTSPSGTLRVGVNQFEGYYASGTAENTAAPIDVGPAWASYTVTFAELGADRTSVRSFDFIAGEGGESFELWVDDLALVCDGACPSFD